MTPILGWINEDQLPEGYPYDRMFAHSKVDVVRMFPIFGPPEPGAGGKAVAWQARPKGGSWGPPTTSEKAARELAAEGCKVRSLGVLGGLTEQPVAFKFKHGDGSWAVLALDTQRWLELPHGTQLYTKEKT